MGLTTNILTLTEGDENANKISVMALSQRENIALFLSCSQSYCVGKVFHIQNASSLAQKELACVLMIQCNETRVKW
jgi:hypothetical protein